MHKNKKKNKKREQIDTLLKKRGQVDNLQYNVLHSAISSQLSPVSELSIQTMSLGETQGPITVNKYNCSETDPFSPQEQGKTVIVNNDDELVKSLRERIWELHNTLQSYEDKIEIIKEEERCLGESVWSVPYEVQSWYERGREKRIDKLCAEENHLKAEKEAVYTRFVQEDEILHELADLAKRELEHIDSE